MEYRKINFIQKLLQKNGLSGRLFPGMGTHCLIFLLAIAVSASGSADSSADTSYIEPKSGYQTQKEKTREVLKKTGKIIMETAKDLGKQILGDSSTVKANPEYLHQQVRLEYEKQCKDIHVPTIKASELIHKYRDTNLVLVDVRQDVEQRVSMIPGAITPAELAKKYRSPQSVKGKTFITYCTIGYRSGLYAESLLNKKIQVLNLEGGILAWSHERGEVVKHVRPDSVLSTREIHVYDESWNFLHPDYTPVW